MKEKQILFAKYSRILPFGIEYIEYIHTQLRIKIVFHIYAILNAS